MKSSLQHTGRRMTVNAAWIVGGKIYQILLNFGLTMATARYLGPANFGGLHYAAAMTGLFLPLCSLGIHDILIGELVASPGDSGSFLGSVILMRLASTLCSMVLLGAAAAALNPGQPDIIRITVVYSVSLLFQCAGDIACWFQVNLQARYPSVISCFAVTVSDLYKLYLLISGRSTVWFAGAYVLEAAVTAGLLLAAYRRFREAYGSLRVCGAACKRLLGKSYHYILSGLMVALYGQMDRVMLQTMLGDAAVGYYAAAVSVSTMWTFVLAAVVDSARPVILAKYEKDRKAFCHGLTWLYRAILYTAGLTAVGICLLSGPILNVVYGAAYLPAQRTLCIAAWCPAFAYLGTARNIWLIAEGKSRYEKYLAGGGAGINLILNRLLIPVMGSSGAALATLITQITTNFIIGFLFPALRENSRLILRAFYPHLFFPKLLAQNGGDT